VFSKILHANDGSAGAFKALEVALSMARHYRSELHMVAVEEMPWLPGTREEVVGDKELADHRFEGVIARAKEQARKQRVKLTTHLLVGHPVKAIADFVGQNAFDALVVGYVGHSQFYSALVGSTAERLVRLAPCTTIVVK
jgi:nucleotide-binding universal stress UspA family protein